jgi:hypothetical protein
MRALIVEHEDAARARTRSIEIIETDLSFSQWCIALIDGGRVEPVAAHRSARLHLRLRCLKSSRRSAQLVAEIIQSNDIPDRSRERFSRSQSRGR